MTLTAGTKLGPYEILALIGAGGMGQVYKAKDTRLDRTVAIKVLLDLPDKSELTQRFEREARTVAALNHPGICTLHDIGNHDGVDYLVMEYVDGETLAARLEKGPLSIEQALKCAIEIADALDKAHRQGVTHRDLKPGNIMLTKSGAKLLDFGLAKFRSTPVVSTSSLQTKEADLTAHGTILGTVQYMAPEQIEGEDADPRSDIFAFGVILYEMITGKKAFKGKSQASLMASILEHEPLPMSVLQQLTPPALDHVVQVCLAKEPENRWQTAHDLKLQLQWIVEGGSQVSVPAEVVSRHKNRERLAWATICLLLGVGLIALSFAYFNATPIETTAVEFSIASPGGTTFLSGTLAFAPFPAASPDGRHVAFVAQKLGEVPRLWVRSVDSSEARVLPGTEGAVFPFWSPDSRSIGFFAAGKLNTVEYSGGPVRVLCDAPLSEGGTWNPEGIILFALNGGAGGLHRVSAAGGQSAPVTVPDAASQETSHRWPYFLPDGRHFLYLAQPSTIYVGSLDSKETKRLLNADSRAIYAPQGFLLFVRQGTLMGQSFNVGSLDLAGEAFRIAENVGYSVQSGRATFSVSNSGLLTYRSSGGAERRVVWFDRNGKQLEPINQTGDSRAPRLSPDETRIAVERQDGGQSDIWVIDLARGTNSRLTFNPRNETEPIWSPDGSRVVYAAESNGKKEMYQKLATGLGSEELVVKADLDKAPTDWSKDGRFLLVYSRANPKTGGDMWVLPMRGDPKLEPLLQTPLNDAAAQFSPDGKWIAYWSTESGNNLTYVQPFPPTGGKVQISIDGGAQPRWRQDGRELFFVGRNNRMMAVDVELGSQFQAGVPKPLFQIPGYGSEQSGGVGRYSVTRDGQRFLLSINNELAESPITVVLNWTAKLKK